VTPAQKKWAIGGSIAAAALAVGYGLFHSRPAHAGFFPLPPLHGHGTRKRHRSRPEERDGFMRENGRGEYGRKKKHHHHRGHKHG